MLRSFFCGGLLWIASFGLAAAQGLDTVRAYMFANSLVNHVSDDPTTNVPHWLDQLARADGRSFAVGGEFTFLKTLPASLPPDPGWRFPGVQRLRLGPDLRGVDTVLLNPENFVQYQPPEAAYEGDNPQGVTPVGATLAAFDAAGLGPEGRYFIYEGWADMDGFVRNFPPNRWQLRRYHRFNQGAYHEWYLDYTDQVQAARPDMQVALIPVASILSDLLTQEPLSDLPVTAIYTDDAPHGTAELYFLAAMITYAAFYEVPPPADFVVPDALDPVIAQSYADLRDAIWERMAPLVQAAAARPAPQPVVLAAREVPDLPPRGARPAGAPALAMGLNGISDWSTQHPFVDLMKTARPWIGHLPGQWGGFDAADLAAGGYLDADGWPLRMPEGVERLETLILTDQPEAAEHLRGRYLVRYDGRGELTLTGRARQQNHAPGAAQFSYSPGDGLVGIAVSATDPDDPIRNIRVFREDHLPLFEAGVLFNPDWIARIADLRVLRFMDWMDTNGSQIATWEQRPRIGDASYAQRGVPVEVMIALANQVGADPWFTLPHMADDAYVRAFAETVRDGLDPELKAYVEYSNEVWNWIFPQAQWAQDQARARWGESEDGWMQFYGLRAAQVMDIFTEVYGPQADARLTRVVAVHTGWPGLEQSLLMAPLAWLTLGRAPQDSFDVYAVSGYFGHAFGAEENVTRLRGWLVAAEAQAQASGEAEGLQRVALREYVSAHRFDAAFAPAAQALRKGSLVELTQELWPHHARVARQAGLRLIMYEGGTHVTGAGDLVNDPELTAFFTAFSYTPEMAALYRDLLGAWTDAGGQLFNAFVDVAPPMRWGSWGALRHLDDANPRWDVLMAHNASAPADWEPRAAEAFANGVMRQAGADAATLEGTDKADILLGGAGNDVLIGAGGDDHLHGGAGQDRAILPGVPAGYSYARAGPALVADGPHGRVQMAGIETLSFSEAPEVVLPVDGL